VRVALHVDQLWFPTPGGIGTYVSQLLSALGRADPSLELLLFSSRWDAGPSRPVPGRVVALPATIRSLYPRWALLGRPSLPEPLASAAIVHATNHAAVPPAGPGQRLVVTVHDLAFEHFPRAFTRRWRWLYRAGVRAAVRRADAIVTPSRSTAEDLLSRTRVDPARIHVVPLAASLDVAAADPDATLERLKVRRPYVLFVGTLEPRKNVVRLVRAYRRAAGTGLPHALVLAGGMGWGHDALLRELALEGPGEVILTGGVGGEDLDALYRRADAFCYPSLHEGFGLPVVEAMARGVPTVTSSTSSLPEVAGDAALLVDPRSVSEIAEALARVLTDRGLAEDLARRGRVQADRFGWDETARGTLRVYEHVLGAK
jgi:glycosyltransferase involved in cell wall biosynthesis